jgi:hypothetical protein
MVGSRGNRTGTNKHWRPRYAASKLSTNSALTPAANPSSTTATNAPRPIYELNTDGTPKWPTRTNEIENRSYNWTLPYEQVFSMYAQTANEKLLVPMNFAYNGTIHVVTEHPVTKSHALTLIQDALLDQAHIKITRSADGILQVISNQGTNGPPGMRTFSPDAPVTPPIFHGELPKQF